MDARGQLEALLREIEDLPPDEQSVRLLDFLRQIARALDPLNLALLVDYFRDLGSPEAGAMAEVLEVEMALRGFRPAA